MKNIILKFIKLINKVLYPNLDIENLNRNQLIVFKTGIVQKIFGFNRHVPWPVHWTSDIISADKIVRGTRSPGLSKGCHIDGRNGINFGKNVWIGPNVKIISQNHDLNDYNQYIHTKPIIVKDNCWIAAGAIILPGVELGEHTVVAAGAVVTKSFPDGNQVLGGIPAKIIKKIPNYKKII